MWEEDVAGWAQQLWEEAGGSGCAAVLPTVPGDNDISEDSNAEDYYGNDYPDEEDTSGNNSGSDGDGCCMHGSRSDDDADESCSVEDGGHQGGRLVAADIAAAAPYLPGVTVYVPAQQQQQQHRRLVTPEPGDDEFDVDEYDSDVMEPPDGLYGGGAAWRAVLAAEYAPAGDAVDDTTTHMEV